MLCYVVQDCAADGVNSYVIDTEVVAYDRDTGNLLPFQVRPSVDASAGILRVCTAKYECLLSVMNVA